MRRIWIIAWVLLLTGTTFAQGSHGWVNDLLPDADDPSGLNKILEQSSEPVFADELLLVNLFDFSDSWETLEADNNYLRIVDNEYHVYGGESGFVYWGQNTASYGDIAVEVRTRQLSEEDNNGFGVACRVSTDNMDYSGYEFFISGDGYYSIARVPEDDNDELYEQVVEWERSSLINMGQDAENHILAVCYEDYLALYINGELAAEARDDMLESGSVAMAVLTYEEDTEVLVAFDDLRIWAVDDTPVLNSTTQRSDSDDINTADDLESPEAVSTPNSVRGLMGSDDNDDENETASGAELTIDEIFADSEVVPGDIIDEDTFDNPEMWAEFSDDLGNATRVQDGKLWIKVAADNGFFVRSLNASLHDDAILQVETTYLAGTLNNAYGLICRGHPSYDGSGYYFYITDLGFGRILRSDEGSFTALTDWIRTPVVRVTDTNTLTVACVGNYLALYVNGQKITEARDDTYNAGYAGMAASHYDEDASTDVEFDNLLVREASFASSDSDSDGDE
jgi:hypothetical protein